MIGAEKVIEGPIRGPSLPLDNPILLRPRYSQFSRSARALDLASSKIVSGAMSVEVRDLIDSPTD